MESQPKEQQAATEEGDGGLANRRTLEFFFMAGILGIGLPIAILMGVRSGERTAALIYSRSGAAAQEAGYMPQVTGSPRPEKAD